MTGKQANGVRNINVEPEIAIVGHNPRIVNQGCRNCYILPSRDDPIYFRHKNNQAEKAEIEELKESCFGSFERSIASYLFSGH